MKILCPTDMSPHSIAALEYAVTLSNKMKAELHIISVYEVKSNVTTFKSFEKHIKESSEEDLKTIVAGIGPLIKNDRIPISRVFQGEASKVIIQYAEKYEIDMIVMGTQGDNSMRTMLFGSVTKKVASKSRIPILAIPMSPNTDLEKGGLLLAIDDKSLEHEATFKIPKTLAQLLNKKIDILHISTNPDIHVDPMVSAYLGGHFGSLYLKEGKDPVMEIKKFTESNNVGILMMIRREKSFLNKLLTIGNTSEELGKTNIPLLILQE